MTLFSCLGGFGRSQTRTLQSGFTLIELMVTLAILAILVAVGIPSFSQTIKNNRLAKATNEVVGSLRYARSEAIKRGNRVHIAQSDGSSWAGGITVWFDSNGDGDYDSDSAEKDQEVLLVSPSLPSDLSLSSATTQITFSADGTVGSVASFNLCDDRSGETGRDISLLVSGVVATANITCP